MVACIALFCGLFVMIMLYYIKNITAINKVEWDVSTVTAADYTIDMQITKDMYNNFAYNVSELYRNQPVGYSLKDHLKHELENVLTAKVPSLGFENVQSIKIADIQFTYKNTDLILLL